MPEPPRTATRLLLRGLCRNKARLTGSFGLLALWQLCETLVPVVIGATIDRAVATSDNDGLLRWGVALCLLFACLSYAYRYGARLGFGVVQDEVHLLRVEIAGHVLDSRGARTGLLPGETLSLASSDAEQVGFVIRQIGYTFAAVISVAVSAFVLLRIDVMLGMVVLLGVPMVLVVIQVVTPLISRRSREQQESIARAAGVATDFVRGLRTLKGVGAEDVASVRYRRSSQQAKSSSIRTAHSYGYLYGMTSGLSGLFLAVVAVLAGRLAMDGEITIGELIAIVGLTQFLAEPIAAIGEISAQAASAHASARRIVDFLHTPRLVASGSRAPRTRVPTLALHGVTTGALRDLSVVSQPGELLGMVVADPAAAARIVSLLNGEVPAGERVGDVLLGDVPFHQLSVESRRDNLIVSQHHVDLFEGTLRSNVDPDGRLDDVGLTAILDASSASEVIELQEYGLDQAVSPNGTTYSGGQRQRLALARALAADVPLLVLHDPTTSVDAVTEQRIARGIRQTRHHNGSTLTTWVITSSPLVLAQADRVVVVRDGSVVLEGTHRDLVADPTYQDLVLR